VIPLLAWLAASSPVFAAPEPTVAPAVAPVPAAIPDPGFRTEKRHQIILGTWAGVNLIGGTTGALLARTPEGRTFHASNALWNTVNLGLAVGGAISWKKRATAPDLETLRKRHRGLRTALAINIGLDVLYVASGVALWAVGGESNGVPLRPIGQALVIQGGFLMGFDAAFLSSHHLRAGKVAVGPGAVMVRF
jgi:hypothetical protein